MTDTTISLEAVLRIAEIVSILGGGGLVAFRLGRVTSRVEQAISGQGDQIKAMQGELKEFGKLMTTVALQGQRLDLLDARYEELRHGEGYVFPLGSLREK